MTTSHLPRSPGLPTATPVPSFSVVVIGRNEAARLADCLASVRAADWSGQPHELIYVDSDSTDSSVAIARAVGAEVLVLTDPAPNAAKARNLGLTRARAPWVLFLDGDTVLHPDFVARARPLLDDRSLCAVWGHRRESRPGQSIYTRLLDLDWIYPAGRTPYFGGDALVRREALLTVGAYDPTLAAGEEPEMCARLRAAGWQIEHVDAPMTTHDLAIRSWRGYARRAFRSGMAYEEVSHRMARRGDALWRREAARDRRHALTCLVAAPALVALAVLAPDARYAAAVAVLFALGLLAMLARSVARSRWKAPGQSALLWQYAVHVQVQKLPALFGQWHARRARRQRQPLQLVEYRDPAAAVRAAGASPSHAASRRSQARLTPGWRAAARRRAKAAIAALLVPVARLWRSAVEERWQRGWSLARLQEGIGRPVDASNVIVGTVSLDGTRRVRLGRDARIEPGVHLETQGEGCIEIGDGVVLSRGVHIVAHGRVRLDDGVMVGEYASLRDADHRRSAENIRDSGHVVAPIHVERNAWIGRGATVLKGVRIGASAVVAAGAVVTRDVAAGATAMGVPARAHRPPALALAPTAWPGDLPA